MVKGASGNLQKEKIINKRKHAGRRPIGIKYFEARMVYRLHTDSNICTEKRTLSQHSVTKSALHQHIQFAMFVRIPSSENFAIAY